jgi:hypothetical protein
MNRPVSGWFHATALVESDSIGEGTCAKCGRAYDVTETGVAERA